MLDPQAQRCMLFVTLIALAMPGAVRAVDKAAPATAPATLPAAAASSAASPDDDARRLLEGVRMIAPAPSEPGALLAFGPHARAVVAGGLKDERLALIACSRWKDGRIVALGHEAYLDPKTLKLADTGALLKNALAWAGGKAKGLRVGVLEHPELQDWLKEQGFAVHPLTGPNWHEKLGGVDVLVAQLVHEPSQAPVQALLARGGGVVLADCGWRWALKNPRFVFAAHPGNLALAEAGLLWTAGKVPKSDAGYEAGAAPSPLLNASTALDRLLKIAPGKPSDAAKAEEYQALATIAAILPVLPERDALLLPALREATTRLGPTAKHQVKPNTLARLLVANDQERLKRVPPRDVKPHPTAIAFPGFVPADAKPVDRMVAIDTRVPNWHGTGLYAPPGALVTLTFPAGAANQGLVARIGCHKDSLSQVKDAWRRMPQITRTWSIGAPAVEIANAFGGLVYIEVPDNCALGKIEVRVQGGVPAPRFVLGQTTDAQWAAEQRSLPGPWAELESSKFIITVPSSFIRELADPTALMEFWDQVLDADADLAGIPRARRRPERFVADEQISAGYMHSGYPIMAHLDAPRDLVDLKGLKAGKVEKMWGFYHELGHNHQVGAWTFGGTGEVTVNLFTMYVFEKVVKREDMGLGLQGLNEARRLKKAKDHINAGAPFAGWKSDPFLALVMYIQLKEAFGWEAFQAVFKEYANLPAKELPKNDDEKRDQWMIRFSKQVKHNLGPFFQTWGVPTSQAARDQIADLPVWMPKGL